LRLSAALSLGAILLSAAAAPQSAPCPCPPPAPATALEAALVARETVAVKTFYEVGQVGKSGVPTVEVIAVAVGLAQDRGRVVKGVQVRLAPHGETSPAPPEAFVDLDECNALLAALAEVLEKADEWKLKALDRTEVSYATRGGFTVGFLQGPGPQRGFVAADAGKPIMTLPFDALRQLRDLIASAVAKLAEV